MRERWRVDGDDDLTGLHRPTVEHDVDTALACPQLPHRAAQRERTLREARGELCAELAHAARRHRDVATEEAAEHELGDARRRREVGIEERAREERSEEALDDAAREADLAQPLGGCDLRACGDTTPVSREDRTAPREQPERIDRRDRRAQQRTCRRDGRAERVGEAHGAAAAVDDDPGRERTQVERVAVEPAAHRRVGGEQHLEPAVDEEPVDLVGTYASTDAVGRLDDEHVTPGLGEPQRRDEAGEAGPDDHDVRGVAHAQAAARANATRSAARIVDWRNSNPASIRRLGSTRWLTVARVSPISP